MSSYLLPRMMLLGPCLLLLGSLSLASGGATGHQGPEPAPVRHQLAYRPLPAPAAPIVLPASASPVAEFSVRASRLGFSVTRDVTVRARLLGLSGQLDVQLDREIKPMFGISEVHLTMQVVDSDGHRVDAIVTSIPARTESFSVPIELPRPGCYELVLLEEDLEAGSARMRIEPAGEVRLPLEALAAGEQLLAAAHVGCCR